MTPYHLRVQNKCQDCTVRSDDYFCGLSQESLKQFDDAKITNSYPPGSMLFVEGQAANGVFMLCHGAVKLYTCSRDGKVVIMHVASPGELLGLSAVISHSNYEVSAEVIEACQVNFIRKADFMRLLNKNADISMAVVKRLCMQYNDACNQIRSLGLSNSVSDKLAKLMLEWCSTTTNSRGYTGGDGNGNGPIRIKLRFTHEEMAEMIGSSRETVTRLLKDFRSQNLITLKGSDLYIHNRKSLEAVIGRPRGYRARV